MLLDVHESLEKLSTMGATYSTGIISVNIDVMIGKNQSAGVKNWTLLHIFFPIQDVIDVSCNLNSNLAWISLNFREPFTE